MRRTFLKEEEVTTPPTLVSQEVPETSVKQPPLTQKALPITRKAVPPHKERGSALKGKLLKGGIGVFASLGICSLLLPLLSGTPLSDLDLKQTYSRENLAFISSNAALSTGNLAIATNAFMTLPPEHPKTKELYAALFPRLLEARNYERAVQILGHTGADKRLEVFPFPPSKRTPEPLSLGTLGIDMEMRLGLEKSMERIASNPDLTAVRTSLLPYLLMAASEKELPALEKLAPALQGEEQQGAIGTIIYAHIQAKNWDAAWRWTAQLPAQKRQAGEDLVLDQMTEMAPREAHRRLATWSNTPEFLSRFAVVLNATSRSRPGEALQMLPQLSSPQLRDQAIGILLGAQVFAPPVSQLNTEEITALLDRQTDPAIKAWTLAREADLIPYRIPLEARPRFILTELAPRFTALARQHPALVPLHDEFLLVKLVKGCPRELQERCLNQILSPAKRKEAADYFVSKAVPRPTLKTDLLDKVTRTRFDLANPVDAAKLTGMRD